MRFCKSDPLFLHSRKACGNSSKAGGAAEGAVSSDLSVDLAAADSNCAVPPCGYAGGTGLALRGYPTPTWGDGYNRTRWPFSPEWGCPHRVGPKYTRYLWFNHRKFHSATISA